MRIKIAVISALIVIQADCLLAQETNLMRAQRVHQEATIVFAHTHQYELSDFRAMLAGGVTAQVMKLTTDGIDWRDRQRIQIPFVIGYAQMYSDRMDAVYDIVNNPANNAMVIRDVADFKTAKSEGKAAVIFGSEGIRHLEGDVTKLEEFYKRGLREIQIYWPSGCQVCDGEHLSDFGRQVIAEANRLGILIDIGHIMQHSDAIFRDVLRESSAPLIHSHDVGQDFGRKGDMTDEQIIALAQSGGGRGVYALHGVTTFYPDRGVRGGESVADAIDYFANRIGIDHIALGPDWFPEDEWQWTYETDEVFEVTLALVKRSYSDQDIKKVLGGNMIRLFENVRAAAKR